MAVYPTDIVDFGPNTDNVTTIDKDYTGQRDAEIEAIEASLGKD
jgi:hypothetical protein